MKKYYLMIIFTLLILTGCKSQSYFSVNFDGFSMRMYDNNKQYSSLAPDTSILGMKVIQEMKQNVWTGYTWFISSFVVVKTAILSWMNIKEFVDSNTKENQIKLLQYKSTDNAKKKIKCNGLQYSWYITAFSYQFEKSTMYWWQYFFTDSASLYVLSLSSDKKKDIGSFINSISTITCTQ